MALRFSSNEIYTSVIFGGDLSSQKLVWEWVAPHPQPATVVSSLYTR